MPNSVESTQVAFELFDNDVGSFGGGALKLVTRRFLADRMQQHPTQAGGQCQSGQTNERGDAPGVGSSELLVPKSVDGGQNDGGQNDVLPEVQ